MSVTAPIRVDLGDGAHALFTTRAGGVSTGPYASLNLGRTVPEGDEDDPAAIEANRDRVASSASSRKVTASAALIRSPRSIISLTFLRGTLR